MPLAPCSLCVRKLTSGTSTGNASALLVDRPAVARLFGLHSHDDVADPTSKDPVARESTRLSCAAVNGAQTRWIQKELREWMPNYNYGAHAFGLPNFQSPDRQS